MFTSMTDLGHSSRRSQGFSLVELLLVLAIIGILAGVAIPAYMGQRRRARVIGDAQSNTRALAMALESQRAENGLYGSAGTSVSWVNGVPSNSTFLPSFSIKNATQMNYFLTITNSGVGYQIRVTDPRASSANVLTTDQTGAVVLDPTYNK